MKNNIQLLLLTLTTIIVVGCNNSKEITTKELETKNPTEYVFNIEIDSLKYSVVNIFNEHLSTSSTMYGSSLFFNKTDDIKHQVFFVAELKEDASFGKKYFNNKETQNNIYLHSFGNYWYSPIYYTDNKKLECRTPFIIELKEVNQNMTLMSIKPEKLVVLNGTECCGPHGFYSKEFEVEPTTVEEYTLILFIAEQLGVTDLKPLNIKTK